ncbi:MAG TPA: DUF2851 family protein [Lutibacter sp.]|nr:DUF2851 family protein [Lutibacter sp.]
MKENFLHYLWKYQLFSKNKLQTTISEQITVQKTGLQNSNSGPDFLEATIQIGEQLWAGSVEIHLKSSDWYVHNHETDTAYDNVILHVVWEDDIPIFRKNNTPISTLVLKGLVPKNIWNNYKELFQKNKNWIPCESQIKKVNSFTWNNWKEHLYIARLENKSKEIEQLLQESVNDWESVLFKLLTKNFGLKVNASSFKSLANIIDYSILRKEKDDSLKLEALLMGQAGLLSDTIEDTYFHNLQKEYLFQQNKYSIQPISEKVQFFRLRPPNFPSIRLSQLANLISKRNSLFQDLMNTKKLSDFYSLLQTNASNYWNTHYVFGKKSKKLVKKTSKSFVDLLLINTIIPLQFAYQKYNGNQDIESILGLIKAIKPEKNSIINNYKKLGIPIENAMDSQALIQLHNNYCKPKLCLSCVVGLSILKE